MKYLRGHREAKQAGFPGTLEVSKTTERGSSKRFDPAARLRKPPNFPKLFEKIGSATEKWGVPEDTWPLKKDEKNELEDFWKELVDRSTEMPLLQNILGVVASVMFLFSVLMIFVPRIYVTYRSLAEKGKDDANASARTGSANPSGIAGNDGATRTSVRAFPGRPSAPWNEPGEVASSNTRDR